ncbi:unnamed protein product [Heterobilharzia americana]|nr:unnamed protein product [Heterobilharzia americana]
MNLIFQTPINNPEMLALWVPKGICNPRNRENVPDLIVIVKSCVYSTSKRHRARQTFMQKYLWPNFNVRFLFVLGIPMNNESNTFKFDDNIYVLNTKWWSLSQKYGDSKWLFIKDLVKEAALYDDLLIGSFHDTYYNLTKKLIFTFRWLSAFCPDQVPLYLFMDDDYDLVPRNVIQFHRNHTNEYLRNMTGGFIRPTRTVFRPLVNETSSVWAMSVKEFPWETYPPYYYGLTYMLGANVLQQLAIASGFVQEIRIDDVYLGILFNKLNITPVHLNIIDCDFSKNDIIFSGGINLHYKTSKRIMNWSSGMPR